MTLDDLTVNLDGHNPGTLLDDWAWLLPETAKPVLVTVWGDVFVADADGRIRFLETCAATVADIAEDVQAFRALLDDAGFVTAWFHPCEVAALRDAGLKPGRGECYSHRQPLVLGGADEPENLELCDIAVHLALTGQIHRQVKELPMARRSAR